MIYEKFYIKAHKELSDLGHIEHSLRFEKSASAGSSQEIKRDLKKPKILLVEDSPIIQIVHKKYLDDLGCDVDVVETGYATLRHYDEGYDLILLDLGLPDIDGISITKAIRQANPNLHIPIVALTTHDKEFRDECIKAGMNDFVAKPISLENLDKLLTRWLSGYIRR